MVFNERKGTLLHSGSILTPSTFCCVAHGDALSRDALVSHLDKVHATIIFVLL